MAYRFNAHTTKGPYRRAYSRLNEQVYHGFTCKVVVGKYLYTDDGYGAVVYVTTSKPVTADVLKQVVAHEFQKECTCEHDCCGHANGGVTTHKVKGNRRGTRWVVPLRYTYNL